MNLIPEEKSNKTPFEIENKAKSNRMISMNFCAKAFISIVDIMNELIIPSMEISFGN